MNAGPRAGIEPIPTMLSAPRRPKATHRAAAAALLSLAMATLAACGLETEYVGACVEDGAKDACTSARGGQCGARARFVEDESCEALGFTHACNEGALPASEASTIWVRSAPACGK